VSAVTPINEEVASRMRHPAGKGRKLPEMVTGVSPRKGSLDGTKKRRARKKSKYPITRNKGVKVLRVDPRIMVAAREAQRPGERLVIVSATEVLLTHL